MIVLDPMNWKTFIEHLLSEFRLSVPDLEKSAGISNVTFYKLVSGETKKPYPSTIKKIETALGIRIDDSDPENITYSRVPINLNREAVHEDRLSAEKTRWPLVVGFVPASTNGGVTTFFEESMEEKPLDYQPDDNFWLRVDLRNGESMVPLINPGDYVLVSRTEKPKHGDIVFVLFLDEPGNRGAVKMLIPMEFDSNMIAFYSYNAQHSPIVKKREQCRIYKVKLIEKR